MHLTSVAGAARRLAGLREFYLLLIIAAAAAIMSVLSDDFLKPASLLATLLGLSVESIVAVGMTVLLVSGGFDLSVGATVGLSGAVTALCLVHGAPVGAAVLAGLATGGCIGLANGLIIARVGINPFVTTLAMMSMARGLLMVIAEGQNISGLPAAFCQIGQGSLLGVQYPILFAIALVAVGDLLLRKSRFLRQNYYLGANEKAAVLSGINADRLKVLNYLGVGVLSALAGIMMTARFGSASVTAGVGLELRVISAVILGGASLQGGEGTVLGAFLGSLLMALIVNALTLLDVNIYWNALVIGATLLVAVLVDTLGRRRQERRAAG